VITAEKGNAVRREALCPDFPWDVGAHSEQQGAS
jgi:hypothetical protein